MSFTFHPEWARMRIPGQVPRLDADLDRTIEQVPRFTIGAQRERAVAQGEPAKPILRAAAVAEDLGLPVHATGHLTTVVKALASSPHELDFRRSLMTHLLEQRYEPALRRAIMERAVSFFRSTHASTSSPTPTLTVRARSRLPNVKQAETAENERELEHLAPYERTRRAARAQGQEHAHDSDAGAGADADKETDAEKGKARGGKYHRRVPVKKRGKTTGYKYVYDEAAYRRLPDAHLDGKTAHREHLSSAVRRVLEAGGEEGCDVEHLRDLVGKHGSKTIASILRDMGATHMNGRIHRVAKSGAAPRFVVRAHACGQDPLAKAAGLGEALPSSSSGGSFGPKGGGDPSPKKLPPGTRRIWHNRIVERGVDDKWHVVGHVAGLEDPGKVPMLHPGEIDEDHKKELIQKLKELIGHEKEKHALIHKPMPGPSDDDATKDQAQKPSAKPGAKMDMKTKSSPAKIAKSAKSSAHVRLEIRR